MAAEVVKASIWLAKPSDLSGELSLSGSHTGGLNDNGMSQSFKEAEDAEELVDMILEQAWAD